MATIEEVLGALGASHDDDNDAHWRVEADVFDAPGLKGEAVIEVFSEDSLGFRPPSPLAALGPLWVQAVDDKKALIMLVRDAAKRLFSDIDTVERKLASLGARCQREGAQISARTTIAGYAISFEADHKGRLRAVDVGGRDVPQPSQQLAENLRDLSDDTFERDVRRVVQDMEQAGFLEGRGLFDARTDRAITPIQTDEPSAEKSAAPAADKSADAASAPSAEKKRSPPRPRRRAGRASLRSQSLSGESFRSDERLVEDESEEATIVRSARPSSSASSRSASSRSASSSSASSSSASSSSEQSGVSASSEEDRPPKSEASSSSSSSSEAEAEKQAAGGEPDASESNEGATGLVDAGGHGHDDDLSSPPNTQPAESAESEPAGTDLHDVDESSEESATVVTDRPVIPAPKGGAQKPEAASDNDEDAAAADDDEGGSFESDATRQVSGRSNLLSDQPSMLSAADTPAASVAESEVDSAFDMDSDSGDEAEHTVVTDAPEILKGLNSDALNNDTGTFSARSTPPPEGDDGGQDDAYTPAVTASIPREQEVESAHDEAPVVSADDRSDVDDDFGTAQGDSASMSFEDSAEELEKALEDLSSDESDSNEADSLEGDGGFSSDEPATAVLNMPFEKASQATAMASAPGSSEAMMTAPPASSELSEEPPAPAEEIAGEEEAADGDDDDGADAGSAEELGDDENLGDGAASASGESSASAEAGDSGEAPGDEEPSDDAEGDHGADAGDAGEESDEDAIEGAEAGDGGDAANASGDSIDIDIDVDADEPGSVEQPAAAGNTGGNDEEAEGGANHSAATDGGRGAAEEAGAPVAAEASKASEDEGEPSLSMAEMWARSEESSEGMPPDFPARGVTVRQTLTGGESEGAMPPPGAPTMDPDVTGEAPPLSSSDAPDDNDASAASVDTAPAAEEEPPPLKGDDGVPSVTGEVQGEEASSGEVEVDIDLGIDVDVDEKSAEHAPSASAQVEDARADDGDQPASPSGDGENAGADAESHEQEADVADGEADDVPSVPGTAPLPAVGETKSFAPTPSLSPNPRDAVAHTSSAELTFNKLQSIVGDGISTGKTGAFELDAKAFDFIAGGLDDDIQALNAEEVALENKLRDVRERLLALRTQREQARVHQATLAAVDEKPKRALAADMAKMRGDRSESEPPAEPVTAAPPLIAAAALADGVALDAVRAALGDGDAATQMIEGGFAFPDLVDDDDGDVFGTRAPSSQVKSATAGESAHVTVEPEPEPPRPSEEATRIAPSPLNAMAAVGLVVQNASALARLEKHLASRVLNIVPLASLDDAKNDDTLNMKAMVFVRPRRDEALRQCLMVVKKRVPSPKVIVLSDTKAFDRDVDVDERHALPRKTSEVANAVVELLMELQIPVK